MKRLPQLLLVLAYLTLAVGLGAGAGAYSYRAGLEQAAEQGRADLALAADRLTSRLLRYRELAVLLTSHPEVQSLVNGTGAPTVAADFVREMADKTGAHFIDIVDGDGTVLASTRPNPDWLDPDQQPLSRALDGTLGIRHRIFALPHQDGAARMITFAAPVFSPGGPSIGAVVAAVDMRGIEENWPGNAPAAYFLDAHGVVFTSNRGELLLTRQGADGTFPRFTPRRASTNEIWLLEGGPYLPRRALHLERALPAIGLTASVLVDTAPAVRNAILVAAAVMALLLVFGAALLIAGQQRRALRSLLAIKAAANTRLETRVDERTRALTTANTELKREVAERKEAEAALKRAQDELVQAGKLSALGEMSAGISHELNQPLMAIRSFADNGELFFQRGDPHQARKNLQRISDLARRAGRIIQNLRSFARQNQPTMTDVDLRAIVDDALEVMAEPEKRHGITVDWARPDTPVMVRGGPVRLQQVVVNLIANAVDAMADMGPGAGRHIEISLEMLGERARLTLSDTGPGLAEPDRVFDPFYSTKAVGAAEGMGLGLSISYGLVQSFGGTLRASNRPEGGAVFTVELRAVQEPRMDA